MVLRITNHTCTASPYDLRVFFFFALHLFACLETKRGSGGNVPVQDDLVEKPEAAGWFY